MLLLVRGTKSKQIRRDKRIKVMGDGGKGNGGYYLMGTEFYVRDDENALDVDSGDGYYKYI